MASSTPEDDFFKTDTPHGLVKRILYKKYLQAYIPKTQYEKKKYCYKTIIIDGFSGTGRYGNEWPNEIEKYGSPLIAVMVSLGFCHKKHLETRQKEAKGKAAKKEGVKTNIDWGNETSTKDPQDELLEELARNSRRTEDKSCEIRMYFVEKNKSNYEKLTSNVELVVLRFLGKYYPTHKYVFTETENKKQIILDTEPFSICIEMIRCEFSSFDPPKDLSGKNTKSLTFLDPYGYTQTPMERVQRFASARGNEVLINFMSSFVNRFVSRNPQGVIKLFGMEDLVGVAKLFCLKKPDLENKKELADFVESVIRSCDPEKEPILRNNICKVTSNYEEFLKKKTGCTFVQSFEIVNKGNITLYHLIHTTNHIKGLKAMKESMNRCSQTEGEMQMSDYQVLRMGHVLDFGNQDNQDTVASAIYGRFAGKEDVEINRISHFVWLETPYVFRKKPLAILQEDGRITRVTGPNGEKQKSKNTFPKSVKWFCSFRSDETEEEDELSSIAAELSLNMNFGSIL